MPILIVVYRHQCDVMRYLSGYRFMWLLVMFDLPVGDKEKRHRYVKFREFLLDQGFDMAQYSVYFRMVPSKEKAQVIIRKICPKAPPEGKVEILMITDKQYENIVSIYGKVRKSREKPAQLALF